MAVTLSRSALLSLRHWWKNLTQNIKPLLSTEWNALKSAGVLRRTRGKRGGTKLRADSRRHRIPTIGSTHGLDESGAWWIKRKQNPVNYGNLLNIQNVTSSSSLGSETSSVTSSSHGTLYFVPSILLSNTMSLAPKIDEIAHTMNSVDAEIALFTETWLSGSVPDEPINTSGYKVFRRDRVGWQHGGVCLYVKSSIQCSILSDFFHPNHEVLWADLRPRRLPRGFSNIIVGVVYQYPDADDSAMRDYLVSSLVSLEATYPNCALILAGNFNRTFLPLIQSAVKAFHLKSTVHFPTRADRTLDQIFTNLGDYFSAPISLPPFGLSDHVTVFMGSGTRMNSKPKRKIIKSRGKRPSKVESVGRFLIGVPWSSLLSSAQSCEEKLSILTGVINFGMDTIMPVRSIKVHETDRPWVSAQLKQLIVRRQKAFASGNKPLFKILRNKVNRERKRCRRVYYENKVKDLQDSKRRDWWREVKQLCGSVKTSGSDLTSVLHPVLVCDESTLANKINQAFISVMEDYSPLTDCVRVEMDDDEPISVTELSVARKLREISSARAGGPDDLPNWALREYADILAAPIADILNTSFSECKVPRAWKLADVLPLPKAPTVSDINKDLRPISLTSTLSKVAEGFVIDKALKPVVLSAIDPAQFGFIPGSCTTFALISMFHHWLRATDGTGSTVRTALLDFRKAFDLIDHHILVAKLPSLGVKPSAVNWIIDFLRSRQQRVKLNGVFSDWLHVPAGVPQGTRLGPWLFLVMINDLRLPPGFLMWKFADDTTVSEVVPPAKQSSLQQAANYIHDWSKENHPQLNPIKCKEIQTNFKRSPPCYSPVTLEGVEFEKVSSAKVLGVNISSDLKWSAHIGSITVKAAKRLYLLRQLKRAGIDCNVLVRFYCSVIRSVLEYACQVFHCSLPNYLSDEIERIQRRALRIIFPNCTYSEGLVRAGLPMLFSRRQSLCQELFHNIVSDSNHKLHQLLPPRASHNRRLRFTRLFDSPICKTNRFIISHSF